MLNIRVVNSKMKMKYHIFAKNRFEINFTFSKRVKTFRYK